MKTKDKIALGATAAGVAAGLLVAYFLEGAHWSIPVIVGALVTGAAAQAFKESVVLDRAIDD